MRVFVIDDDTAMSERIMEFLRTRYEGAAIFSFSSGNAALAELYRKPELIILDYHLKGNEQNEANGITLLGHIKDVLPNVPVMFLADHEDETLAADTIRHGAYDYIVKNDSFFQRLEIMINNATGQLSVQSQLRRQRIFNVVLIILMVAMVAGFVLTMLR